MPARPSSATKAPARTSAEAFENYVGGTTLGEGVGKAWRHVKVTLLRPARENTLVSLPAVSEPSIIWTVSGELDFQERENAEQPWIRHRVGKGTLFLTTGGESYDCRWTTLSPETPVTFMIFLGLPLLRRALEEEYGDKAALYGLRDVSAFRDPFIESQAAVLHAELLSGRASPLLVEGVAQAIAVHLVRHYADRSKGEGAGNALPGFMLRRITGRMTADPSADFSLDTLSAEFRLSKFHFLRLFKKAVGVSPSKYLLDRRMDLARKLLRETEDNVLNIALRVGYASPATFGKFFRRENGVSPAEYRRRR